MTSIKDIYWLAGFLEGEGCFMRTSVTRQPNNKSFIISVGSTDKDVIVKASMILHGKEMISLDNHRSNCFGKKPIYKIRVSGKQAIAWMMTIYSLMGQRRKDKIKSIIDEWKAYTSARQKVFA